MRWLDVNFAQPAEKTAHASTKLSTNGQCLSLKKQPIALSAVAGCLNPPAGNLARCT
jgi:hypothetical protein